MPRTLVLEDDDDLREVLGLGLEGIGQEVVQASSVSEMPKQDSLGCQNAILDVNLGPGVPTGIDAARWLRAQGFQGGITFLTGHAASYPELRLACAELDAGLLEKPVPFELLAKQVSKASP
jgi:CheY-like chemotaxis protein